MQRAGKLSDAQRYGLAYAHLLAGHGAEAAKELAPLLEEYPGDLWLLLAAGQAKARAGAIVAADAIFEDLVARLPRNRAVAPTYDRMRAQRKHRAARQHPQDAPRPLPTGQTS